MTLGAQRSLRWLKNFLGRGPGGGRDPSTVFQGSVLVDSSLQHHMDNRDSSSVLADQGGGPPPSTIERSHSLAW